MPRKRKITAVDEGGPVIDEGFRRLIPPLADNEYDRLEASIQAEGCREPVILWSQGNLLLDGHNRVAICETYGIEYRTTVLDFPFSANNPEDHNQTTVFDVDPDTGEVDRSIDDD